MLGRSSIASLLLCLSLLKTSRAAVTPTAPGPGQTFNEGASCSFSWTADTTGTWTSFDVDLMSGSNQEMSVVTRVESGLDGAKSGTASFICPSVTPNSAIYFYQFTQGGAGATWTTRFTLASASGASTAPQHATQSDGSATPWGVGTLLGAGGAVASGSSASASSGTRASATSSSTMMTSAVTTTTATNTPASPTATTTASSSAASPTTVTSTSTPSLSSSSVSPTAAPASSGGAFFNSWPIGGRIGFFVGIGVAGLAVLALLIWLCVRLVRRKDDDGATDFVNEWDHADQDPYYLNHNRTLDDVGSTNAHQDGAGYADEKIPVRSNADDPYSAAAAGELRYTDHYASPMRTPGLNEAYPLVPRNANMNAQHSTVDVAGYQADDHYGYADYQQQQPQPHESYAQSSHYPQDNHQGARRW